MDELRAIKSEFFNYIPCLSSGTTFDIMLRRGGSITDSTPPTMATRGAGREQTLTSLTLLKMYFNRGGSTMSILPWYFKLV